DFDESAFLEAHRSPAVSSIRLNPSKKTTLDFECGEKVPWCDNGFYLPERPVFTLDPAFHSGAYYVQEASSMFLQHVLKQLPNDGPPKRVLDLCAAPGGKSTILADWLRDTDLLISNETIRSRAGFLHDNMIKWGKNNTWVTCNDPRELSQIE